MHLQKLRKTIKDEAGQVLAFTLVCMVVLIAMVGFAVDVGHAYLVQRQLQSGVDAAALAGAQELPDPVLVTSVAKNYGPNSTKNPPTAIDNSTTTVEMKCVTTAPGCSSTFNTFNAVKVTATSDVKTFFARIIGVDSLNVHATATACSPCSSKPLDIMIVLDRTGSMCDVSDSGGCRDENFAIEGINKFLDLMDPALDEVGLAVFPPALDKSSLCKQPTAGAKRYGYDAWWTETNDDGPNNEDSAVYTLASPDFNYTNMRQKLASCIKPNGTTSYTNAPAEAEYQLIRQGRGNIQNVIVILSDGAANATPKEVPAIVSSLADRARPCRSGVKVANQIKGQGTIIYTIGYDVDADSNGGQCGAEGLNASDALKQMASVDEQGIPNYYVKPDPGQLNTIFTKIAADISRPSSRLIPDS